MTLSIARADAPEDLDAVRDLVRAFFAWSMAKVGAADNPSVFAGLETELAGRPGRFGPPMGCLLLARLDGAPVGCVSFRGQGASTMEIKRMFVRPDAWGRGVGAAMLDRLLAEARAVGCTRYILSTHRDFHAAQALYGRAGFRTVPASPDFPGIVEGVDVCMEMIPAPIEGEPGRHA
jgi:GNAT superfamily N-acetyltransferase